LNGLAFERVTKPTLAAKLHTPSSLMKVSTFLGPVQEAAPWGGLFRCGPGHLASGGLFRHNPPPSGPLPVLFD
ncbi:hypothetical protein, partial [Alloalcanivorax dieselolei]|uniref:hypothetical protein n=1 Tax=Alloalcanivorax dieselolei TaxID=285091 RepID=UPI001E5B30B6